MLHHVENWTFYCCDKIFVIGVCLKIGYTLNKLMGGNAMTIYHKLALSPFDKDVKSCEYDN